MKYICTQSEDDIEEVFIFPKTIDHDTMAEVIRRIKNRTWGDWHRVRRVPISAGFVDADNNCSGCSETLGLKSRPVDTDILANQR